MEPQEAKSAELGLRKAPWIVEVRQEPESVPQQVLELAGQLVVARELE